MRAPAFGLALLLLPASAAAAPVIVPFDLVDNQLIAQVTVDGRGPFRFVLDTGGGDLITPDLAARLGLSPGGDVTFVGTGDGTVQGGVVTVPQVAVSGLVLGNEPFFTLPLDAFDRLMGIHVDGMLGYELFRRYVVRFDFAARTMTLIDPAEFKPDGAGAGMAMDSSHRTPRVKGSYDGIPGIFDIDTGDNGGLTLTGPFVALNGLRERPGKHVDVVSGAGVGGDTYARIIRGAEFELGGVSTGHPVTSLSANAAGEFASADFAGNVGTGLAERFVMTLDYPHNMLYLKPGGLVQDLDLYDRSGMALIPNPAGFEVYFVTAGGPAAEAGIRKADIVTAVDGMPATAITLDAMYRRQRGNPPGTVLHLHLADGRDVAVTLRDQI
ncbi:MAG: aspartyl protease family protein [Rhizomicrobium sp.]